MRLLIITQKVDMDDDILGFFHRWLLELAKQFEYITVICLQKGRYQLPSNVKVLSLGKEKQKSKIGYIITFYKYIFRERKNYDAVFVHMNPEYVILGGLLWKTMGKTIYLWYNHKKGGIRARIARMFSKKVFCTSSFAYMARFKKSKVMPVGIDVETFKRNKDIDRKNRSILSLGRISPVKRIDVLIKAFIELDKRGIEFEANIYGDPTDRDAKYYKKIRNKARILEGKNKVFFHKGVSYTETPNIYNRHQIFVNLTPSGSMDKTIFEAMACETVAIIENESLKDSIPPELFFDGSADNLADKIEYVLSLSDEEREDTGKLLRYEAVEKHSLYSLVCNLYKEMLYIE